MNRPMTIFSGIFLFAISHLAAGEMSVEEINAALAPYREMTSVGLDNIEPYGYHLGPINNVIRGNIGDWVIIETNTTITKYTLIRIEQKVDHTFFAWEVDVLEDKEREPPKESEKALWELPSDRLFADVAPWVIVSWPYGVFSGYVNGLYPIPFRLESRFIRGKCICFFAVDKLDMFKKTTRYFSYHIPTPLAETELITRDHNGNVVGYYRIVRDFYTKK